MKKKVLGAWTISIVLLSIVLVASISIASAFDIDGEEFTNSKPITIDNTGNANTLTDYQLKIAVSHEPEMQPGFDDLRFTDSGGNVLSYWVEDVIPSARATVWVKVTSIPGGVKTTMWMYYGNDDVSSQSDGDATFDIFEDFDHDDGEWSEDDPNDKIELDYTTDHRLKFNNWIRTDPGYVYKSCSAQNFVEEYEICITSYLGNANTIGPGFSDTRGTKSQWQNGVGTEFYAGFGDIRSYIMAFVDGNNVWGHSGERPPHPNSIDVTTNTIYYVRLEKFEDRIKLSIFSDPARTAHIAESPKEVSADNLADTTFGYYYLVTGYTTLPPDNPEWTSGWMDNFRVREYAEPEPTVEVVSSQPNLAFIYGGIFSPDGISIYPDELLVGDPANIEVCWENKGEGWCEDDFDVLFYLGDPDVDNDGVIDVNANVIGSDHVDGLFPPDEDDLVVLEWTPSKFGTFDIYVVVDPEVDTSDSKIGAVVESDEEDNEVHTSVVVRPAIYGFVNVDTVPRTHVAGIPVYLYQEGKGNIDDDITDTGGFYKFRLSEEIDPTTDKFYVLAKWENDAVRIRDWVFIRSEVIRARWPEPELLNEDIYMEIPLDGEWPEILFDDDDALRDYNHAKIIFDAINESYNYVTERYYPFGGDYNPNMVDVYIHDRSYVATQLTWTDGTIHFADKNSGYTRFAAIHEYGHAIHYQYGGCHLPLGAKGMEEGWAMYFESLFDAVPYGDEDFDCCNVPLPSSLGYILGHTWGQVYAGIFIDLKDGGSNDDDGFDGPSENGEEQIWQAFMANRVDNIDEFYNMFTEGMNRDKKEAVRTIYATKRVRVPDYNLKFIDVDFPYLIRDGEEVIITFKVKNYADYSDSCDVRLTVSRVLLDETNNPYPEFVSFGYQEENGNRTKRVPIDLNSGSEVDKEFKWKVDLSYSGEHEIHLALVPRDWPLIIEGDNEESLCFSPNNYLDNGWIDSESGSVFPRLLESTIVPAEAPEGVSQKIESAIAKLDHVIDFLDQGKYCNAINKLDGVITQIEGAIEQVNEQRCSVKECKGKKCICIADEDANELIESLEHAKEGAIAIRDFISAEHPECAYMV